MEINNQKLQSGQSDYVTISKDFYEKLQFLGIIPNEIRSGNVGKSDYSKHIIQPWSIWLDYKLNPWDADIIKRTLREKEEAGMSSIEARIMDYDKIIHICQERKRQLKQVIDKCDNLKKSTEEVPQNKYKTTIKDYILQGSEITKYEEFKKKHEKCSGEIYILSDGSSGIGVSIKLKCSVCGEEEDITDYNMW